MDQFPEARGSLRRIHSVQIRVPHAKSAKDAKKLERYARKTSRQTVNGVSVDKMPPPPVFTLRPLRPWREVSSASVRLRAPTPATTKPSCAGLTPRAVLEKFATVQMIDAHLPTTDGREIVMARHTQPEKDLQLLLDQLKLELPEQGPPKIQAMK